MTFCFFVSFLPLCVSFLHKSGGICWVPTYFESFGEMICCFQDLENLKMQSPLDAFGWNRLVFKKVCEIDFLSESDMPMILSMTLRITTWIASDLGWLSLSVNYNHSRAITWHLRTFMHHMGSELKLSRWVIYQVGSFSFEAEWVLKVGGKWVNPGFKRVGTMLCHCVCSGISVRVLIHLMSFECWDIWCSLTVQLACKPLGTMVTGTSWRGRRVPRWRWIRPLSCAPMR